MVQKLDFLLQPIRLNGYTLDNSLNEIPLFQKLLNEVKIPDYVLKLLNLVRRLRFCVQIPACLFSQRIYYTRFAHTLFATLLALYLSQDELVIVATIFHDAGSSILSYTLEYNREGNIYRKNHESHHEYTKEFIKIKGDEIKKICGFDAKQIIQAINGRAHDVCDDVSYIIADCYYCNGEYPISCLSIKPVYDCILSKCPYLDEMLSLANVKNIKRSMYAEYYLSNEKIIQEAILTVLADKTFDENEREKAFLCEDEECSKLWDKFIKHNKKILGRISEIKNGDIIKIDNERYKVVIGDKKDADIKVVYDYRNMGIRKVVSFVKI